MKVTEKKVRHGLIFVPAGVVFWVYGVKPTLYYNYGYIKTHFVRYLLYICITMGAKGKTYGIRVNEEQLKLIMKAEKLDTIQKVVDFLINAYHGALIIKKTVPGTNVTWHEFNEVPKKPEKKINPVIVPESLHIKDELPKITKYHHLLPPISLPWEEVIKETSARMQSNFKPAILEPAPVVPVVKPPIPDMPLRSSYSKGEGGTWEYRAAKTAWLKKYGEDRPTINEKESGIDFTIRMADWLEKNI